MERNNNTLDSMLEGFDSLEDFADGLELTLAQKLRLYLTLFVIALYRIFILPFRNSKTKELKEGLERNNDIGLQIKRYPFPKGEGNHYLTEEEISQFEKTAVVGPFPVISGEEAQKLGEFALEQHENDFGGQLYIGTEIEKVLKKYDQWTIIHSGYYQALQLKQFRDLLKNPKISHRLASILGEEVICWRNQFFQKKPGATGTFWHQTSAFREQAKAAKLVPTQPVPQPILQLTVWIALTDVTPENGAMRIIPGSFTDGRIEYLQGYTQDNLIDYLARQDKARLPVLIKAALFSTGGFIRSQALLESSWNYLEDPFEGFSVKDLSMKAGEAVIFSSLNMHGSYSNSTENEYRLAFAGRITANHVKVFPGMKVSYLGTPEGTKPIPLDNISSIQLHGKDSYGFNKILEE